MKMEGKTKMAMEMETKKKTSVRLALAKSGTKLM